MFFLFSNPKNSRQVRRGLPSPLHCLVDSSFKGVRLIWTGSPEFHQACIGPVSLDVSLYRAMQCFSKLATPCRETYAVPLFHFPLFIRRQCGGGIPLEFLFLPVPGVTSILSVLFHHIAASGSLQRGMVSVTLFIFISSNYRQTPRCPIERSSLVCKLVQTVCKTQGKYLEPQLCLFCLALGVMPYHAVLGRSLGGILI